MISCHPCWRNIRRGDLVLSELAKIPNMRCATPQGAFYVFPAIENFLGKKTPQARALSSDEDFVAALLEEKGVATVQGACFLYPDISASPTLLIAPCFSRLARVLSRSAPNSHEPRHAANAALSMVSLDNGRQTFTPPRKFAPFRHHCDVDPRAGAEGARCRCHLPGFGGAGFPSPEVALEGQSRLYGRGRRATPRLAVCCHLKMPSFRIRAGQSSAFRTREYPCREWR